MTVVASLHKQTNRTTNIGGNMDEIDLTLQWLLRRAGDEWGPLGVARAAARLARHHVEPGLAAPRETNPEPSRGFSS